MFSTLMDYMVLELVIGAKLVDFIESHAHNLLYVLVLIYFVHAVARHKERRKLIKLAETGKLKGHEFYEDLR